MYKVVYNSCFGGFELSAKAIFRYYELKGIPIYAYAPIEGSCNKYHKVSKDTAISTPGFFNIFSTVDLGDSECTESELFATNAFYQPDIQRHDKYLVQTVEELGDDASGSCAKLKIRETYSRIYHIDDYDGRETIQEISDEDYCIIND